MELIWPLLVDFLQQTLSASLKEMLVRNEATNQLDQILETLAYPKIRKRPDDTNKYAVISHSPIRQFCASWSMRLMIQYTVQSQSVGTRYSTSHNVAPQIRVTKCDCNGINLKSVICVHFRKYTLKKIKVRNMLVKAFRKYITLQWRCPMVYGRSVTVQRHSHSGNLKVGFSL